MAKKKAAKKTATKKKDIKIKTSPSFEQLLKLAATTPPKKKK